MPLLRHLHIFCKTLVDAFAVEMNKEDEIWPRKWLNLKQGKGRGASSAHHLALTLYEYLINSRVN